MTHLCEKILSDSPSQRNSRPSSRWLGEMLSGLRISAVNSGFAVVLHFIFWESILFSFSFFFNLTYSRWTSSLPSCLWPQRIFPSLPGSRLTFFLSRCKFSTLTTRQPMVEFYLLTFPRFPLRKKEHKSYFGKNRTHDFRTSRYAGYLLDHSGDDCKLRVLFCNRSNELYLFISQLQLCFPLGKCGRNQIFGHTHPCGCILYFVVWLHNISVLPFFWRVQLAQ